MKKLSKKALSILLSVLMIFSVVAFGTVNASGTTPDILYIVPNSNWKISDARFAAYFYNGDGTVSTNDAWMSAEETETEGVYQVAIPDGGWTEVIFCRMNPSNTENNWNNKWNQTGDLVIPTDGANCYTVEENTWDKGGGIWSTYIAGGEIEETEKTSPVVELWGSFNNWSGAKLQSEDGVVYTTTVELAQGEYKFKIVEDEKWLGNGGEIVDTTATTSDIGWEMSEDSPDCALKATGGTYTFSFNAETNMLIVLCTTKTFYKAGTEVQVLWGFQNIDEFNGIQFAINYDDTLEYVEGSATCPHVADAYIADDNSGEISVNAFSLNTRYDISADHVVLSANFIVKEDVSKIGVSSYIEDVYLISPDDNTFIGIEDQTNDFRFVVVSEPTDAPSESSSEVSSESESTSSVSKQYTLIGYINGMNVGCQEDADTVVEAYNFVDGKVTVDFAEDSYVFVKTTDNKEWYMFDGFCTSGSGTMYNTSSYQPQDYFDKMFVSEGKVEFTLVENEDGTLNLSYSVIKEPESSEPATSETESGEVESKIPDTLYFAPNSYWKNDDARFATFFYTDDAQYAWASAENTETDGVYKFAVPDGGWNGVVFCRMNPNNQENSWDNKWNQSGNIVIPTDGRDYFTLNENTWDSGEGVWSTYTAGGEIEETEKPTHIVKLAGDFNYWLGKDMQSEDGVNYTTTVEFEQGVYEFKIVEDDMWLGNEGAIEDTTETTSPGVGWELGSWVSSNCTLIATGGTYTFNFNIETNMLIVLLTPAETEPTEISSETIPTGSTGTTGGNVYEGKTCIVNTGNYENLTVVIYDILNQSHEPFKTIECVFDENNVCEFDINVEMGFMVYNGSELLFTSYFDQIKGKYISTKTFGIYDTLEDALNAQPVETEPTEPSSQEPETQPTTQSKEASLAGTFNDWNLQAMDAQECTTVVRKYVLPAGKYAFKMVEGDFWYGSGSEIANTTTDLQLSKTQDDCVLNAVGGEYTFTYNTETHKLTIAYAECDVVESNGIDGAVTLAGDFNNWEKEPVFMENDEVVVIRKQLAKGAYNFKFVSRGLWYGSASTFTDTTTDLQLDKTYGDSVLVASGGEYTFRYNKVTQKLTVDYKACDVAAEVKRAPSQTTIAGDFNCWAQQAMFEETNTVVRKTVDLPRGRYPFKVVYRGLWYGCGGDIENQCNDIQLGCTSSECILEAQGGRYTFEFDLVTKKLNVLYEECEILVESDAKLSGEFNNWAQEPMMVADDNKVTTKMELPKGKYQFKVVDGGLWYGSASSFTNTATDLDLGYTLSECVLDAEGGMYTFTYDVVKKTLTVECDRYDVKVKSNVTLSGDFNGWAQDTMYVESEDVVSANVTLDAGKYQFKIVKDGLWYGSASEFENTATDLQLNCTYSECILNATGGTYKITYNTKTKTMSVTAV